MHAAAVKSIRTGDGSTKPRGPHVEQLVQLLVVEEADDRGELALKLLTSASCRRHERCPRRGQRRGVLGASSGTRGPKTLDFPVAARGSSPPPRIVTC